MNVLLLHDRPAPGAREDELDAIVQAGCVAAALRALGHEPRIAGVSADLGELDRLLTPCPDMVFNLVESLGGSGRLIGVVPMMLEARGIAYTGAPALAVTVTSSKVYSKGRMAAAGIPTPAFVGLSNSGAAPADEPGSEWIIKSVWEHASIGIEETSIVTPADAAALRAEIARRAPALGGEAFAEQFIEGREFNLSILAGPEGPEVLPPAEIDFSAFGRARRRIVGYRAKWAPGSFEFEHTPRRFDFPPADAPLLERLKALALECWALFGLRGYARVDFRVDRDGSPWVLEVNTNPCLSPDAGFQAALARAGIGFGEAVARILADTNG